MAEVTRVLGTLQLDTEGGLVPASGKGLLRWVPSRRCSRLVKDDPAAAGATKDGRKAAVARNKAVGYLTGEIGVTKAVAGNKEAAGSFTGEIGDTKADAGSKGAAGIVSGEIGVIKADAGNKGAAGSVTSVIGVTKADPGNKGAAGSVTGKMDNTKPDAGNKEAAGSVTGEIDDTKAEVRAAGPGVVTEKDWYEFVFPVYPPAVGSEHKADPTGSLITKERVPDCFIEQLKSRPVFSKMPPLCNENGGFDRFPETRDLNLYIISQWNYLVDLHVDILRQIEVEEKPFAEVGVDFSDGTKKIFVLPKVEGCAP